MNKYDHMIPHPIVIDDLLPENTVNEILEEIKELPLNHVSPALNYRYWQYSLDFIQPRSKSAILREFDAIWDNPRMLEALEKNYNYAAHMMKGADVDYTQIKIEGPDDECAWHRNDFARSKGQLTLITWLYYLKPEDNYTGGELEYSFENIRQKVMSWDPVTEPKDTIKIENKHNRMVLIPSFFWHRVHPPEFLYYNNPMDGRISINGHVGYRLLNTERNLKFAVWEE